MTPLALTFAAPLLLLGLLQPCCRLLKRRSSWGASGNGPYGRPWGLRVSGLGGLLRLLGLLLPCRGQPLLLGLL